jgi:hypothetical protein
VSIGTYSQSPNRLQTPSLYNQSITIPRDEAGSQFSTANVLQVGFPAGKPAGVGSGGFKPCMNPLKIKQVETSQTWAVF